MGKLRVLFVGGSGIISSACARVAVEIALGTAIVAQVATAAIDLVDLSRPQPQPSVATVAPAQGPEVNPTAIAAAHLFGERPVQVAVEAVASEVMRNWVLTGTIARISRPSVSWPRARR